VVYLPHQGNPYLPRDVMIMVRGRSDPAALAARLREEVRTLDPDMPLFNIRPLDEVFAEMRWASRTFGTMFVIFAAIALVLSAVGLYAVTAYSVTQRRQEIGVRMALGAEPRQITWLVLRRGLIQVAVGLVLGFAGAVGVGRLLQSLLYQTSPTDPVTLAGISLVLIFAAVTACLRPARLAMDPLAIECVVMTQDDYPRAVNSLRTP
jgi:putative ABC transport system permease protein